MQSVIQKIESKYRKAQVVNVKTGDTVRVSQLIKEGNKERVQIFEGIAIKTSRKGSLTSSITVRRIASGIGVEKSFLMHSPNVLKIEVTKRTKVRRNYLSYMRKRSGKSTRLTGIDFDKHQVNIIRDLEAEKTEAELLAKKEAEHIASEAKKAAEHAAAEKKFAEAVKEREK